MARKRNVILPDRSRAKLDRAQSCIRDEIDIMPRMEELYRANGVEVARLRAADAATFPRHTHAEYVISANLSGRENIWVDGKSFSASEQTVTIYNPYAVQSSTFDVGAGSAEFVSLYIEPKTLTGLGEANGWLSRSMAPEIRQGAWMDRQLYRSILDVYHAMRSPEDGDLEASLIEMAALLLVNSPRGVTGQVGWARARLDAVLEYMRSRLDGPVRLDELAGIADVSKFHLIRSFREAFGMPPGQYHMQLRLIEARHRLRAGQLIPDVSFDLGFFDQSHFINAFRKVLGVSPLRFAVPARVTTRSRG